MAGKLCFVTPSGSPAEEQARFFAEHGWDVAMIDPREEDAVERIIEVQPLASIFSLEDECPETLTAADALERDERSDTELVVFTGGTPEQISAAKTAVAHGVFVSPGEVYWVVTRLVFNG